ncbi:hypothetical protein MKX01_038118 [Papaver californicum]|nr:hypothetical protein MKX01_038118 [Papaver californicum]
MELAFQHWIEAFINTGRGSIEVARVSYGWKVSFRFNQNGTETTRYYHQEILTQCNVVIMALGGSTNVVLHLIAIARSVGLEVTLEEFQKISDEVPFLADLKPSGKYVMEDLQKVKSN